MSSKLAFIGVGNIGGRLIHHLVRAGHDVRVHDVSACAMERAVKAGARAATAPGDAAAGAEAVFLSLPTPAVVEGVVNAILPCLTPGAILVDHSTIDPETTRRLAAKAEEVDVTFLDAPVSGGVQGADAGSLAVMVGGPSSGLARVRPFLETYAASIVHVGASGSGQVVKLANNMITATNIVALGEALTTVVHEGVDLDTALSVLTRSSANSTVLSSYFPRTLFTAERPTGFALDFMHKDLCLYFASAAASPIPRPVSGLVRDLFSIGRQAGRGSQDFTSVVEFYEDFAGIRLQTKGDDQ